MKFSGELASSGGFPGDFEFETTKSGKPVGHIQRGHALELYRTEKGNLILFIEFLSAWDNEPGYFEVHVTNNQAETLRVISDYRENRIMNQFVGPPPGSLYAKKNRDNLIKSYKLQFDDAVTELMGFFEPEVIE